MFSKRNRLSFLHLYASHFLSVLTTVRVRVYWFSDKGRHVAASSSVYYDLIG